MSIGTIFESLAESISVKVAARLALLGVVALATLGLGYYVKDQVDKVRLDSRIQNVQTHHEALEAKVSNSHEELKKALADLKVDMEKRQDRMEDKLDKLLLRRQ